MYSPPNNSKEELAVHKMLAGEYTYHFSELLPAKGKVAQATFLEG